MNTTTSIMKLIISCVAIVAAVSSCKTSPEPTEGASELDSAGGLTRPGRPVMGMPIPAGSKLTSVTGDDAKTLTQMLLKAKVKNTGAVGSLRLEVAKITCNNTITRPRKTTCTLNDATKPALSGTDASAVFQILSKHGAEMSDPRLAGASWVKTTDLNCEQTVTATPVATCTFKRH